MLAIQKSTFFRSGARVLVFRGRHYSDIPSPFEELHPSLLERAEVLSHELKDLEQEMSKGVLLSVSDQKKFSRISSVTDTYAEYNECLRSYKELQNLLNDETLKEEAEHEIKATVPKLVSIADKLKSKLLPQHPFADKPCILELRPGVGGVEAMIFANDLLNMYLGYASFHRWPAKLISKSTNQSGNGILEAILTIDEPGSYDRLRFEAGVHRVQRIPETETKGRTQTSTAAVVVLPQMGEADQREDADERVFKPGEVRIDLMRASGKGGQHVNTTDSAVRLTHFPTGIVVSMQDERSQHKNKAKAFTILRARIAEKERKEKAEKDRAARTDQVTTTDRSDKIRTYNYSQNRITDHRCGFSVHDIDKMMRGEKLDDMVDALEKHEANEKSKEMLRLLTLDSEKLRVK